jgi:hypothetical protein
LSVLLAPTARAAEAPAWLSWRAADGEASSAACFDETAFEANLSRRLGEDAATVAERAGVRLTIEVGNDPASPSLVATFAGADGRVIGRRALQSPGSTCAAAVDALAIAAALFLEDAGAPPAEAPPPRESTPAAPAAPATPPVASTATINDAGAGTRGVRVGARGGALMRAGDVPLGLWGLQASVELRAPTALASLFFVAMDLSPRQHASSAELDVGYALTLVTGRAGLCPFEHRWRTRTVAGCAALGVGRLSVAGDGLNGSSQRWRVALDGGTTLTQFVASDWSVAAEVRVEVPFQRDRFTVTDATGQSGNAFRAAPLGGAAVLSLGYSPGGQE